MSEVPLETMPPLADLIRGGLVIKAHRLLVSLNSSFKGSLTVGLVSRMMQDRRRCSRASPLMVKADTVNGI